MTGTKKPARPTCDGDGHEWEALPAKPGEPWRAKALCCGTTAVYVGGSWQLDTGIPRDVTPAALAPMAPWTADVPLGVDPEAWKNAPDDRERKRLLRQVRG